METAEMIRLPWPSLRMLFAVDPAVGEDFVAANPNHLSKRGATPAMPKRAEILETRLRLELVLSGERLGQINLIDTRDTEKLLQPASSLTSELTMLLQQLGHEAPLNLKDAYNFLTDAAFRKRSTARARQLGREGMAALAIAVDKNDSKAAMQKIFAAADWAEMAHADLRITGRAASWYLGYAALMAEAGDLAPAHFEEKITPLFRKDGARQTTMLAWLAQVLCESQAGDRVAFAADACLARGMKRLSQATLASGLEPFYAQIYASLPHLLAAFLLAGITGHVPEHTRSARAAELAILRSLHALQTAIADQQGLTNLRGYQAEIAALRTREGDGEARRMALELTDMTMLYPAVCKPILVGDVRL